MIEQEQSFPKMCREYLFNCILHHTQPLQESREELSSIKGEILREIEGMLDYYIQNPEEKLKSDAFLLHQATLKWASENL